MTPLLTLEQFEALRRLDTCTVCNAIENFDVAVSHSYVHLVKLGGAVEIGGLKVQPGDLIHGDCHGVLSIPKEVAGDVPEVAGRMIEKERKLIGLCRVSDFSIQRLRQIVRETI